MGTPDPNEQTSVSILRSGFETVERLTDKLQKLPKSTFTTNVFKWLEEQHDSLLLAAAGYLKGKSQREILELVVNQLRAQEGLPPCDSNGGGRTHFPSDTIPTQTMQTKREQNRATKRKSQHAAARPSHSTPETPPKP